MALKHQLNFALLGRGKFGKNYYRILRKLSGVSLKTIVTARAGNLAKVLGDPSIHCVVIATPPPTHFSLARAVLLAGKHVLVEKPMVLNVDDAKRLAVLVKKTGAVFMVGHQYLYNDYIRHLGTQIAAGALGKIKCILFDHFLSPKRRDVNLLWDTAPHALAVFQHLFNPRKIIDVCVKNIHNAFISANIKFDRGPLFCMRSAWVAPEKVRKITIIGEKRSAILDETLPRNKLRFSNPAFTPMLAAREPLQNEIEHFIACVKGGRQPWSGVGHGLRVIQLLEELSKGRRAQR